MSYLSEVLIFDVYDYGDCLPESDFHLVCVLIRLGTTENKHLQRGRENTVDERDPIIKM